MRKQSGKVRASLEEIKKMKGRSNLSKLIQEQKREKNKPENQED
ncbi:hypothetical protein ACXWHK_004705 [Vibrio alginolyticus]|nr:MULTISPECIES: hypothetical protein [unclassified Vibrio]MDW1675215.1 hypothetical protein [Vibrio sp. Vb2610]MDW1807375.1 hypothetical protein [Vibrio sp. Vb2628]